MSTIRMGWETWLAYGVETNIGTPVAAGWLWEGEGDDSLSLGYQRYDRNPASGYRASRSGQYRIGHKLPGGGLPAAPLTMSGSSLPLLNLLLAHFQGSAFGSYATGTNHWTFTRPEAQKATSTMKGLTFIKNTGVASYAELYSGCVVDQLVIAGQHGGFVTLTPTLKALSGTYNSAAGTGSYTPATGGMFQFSDLSVSWQGESIYPSAWSVTSMNNIPDLVGPGVSSRHAYALGAATGEISLTIPRSDSDGTLYMSKYVTPSIGTLIISGTAPVAAGTLTGGGGYSWTLTAYAVPRPHEKPTGQGERSDTVTMDLVNDQAFSVKINSDASAL